MRYHTLLTELLKCTPIHHPDYELVKKADEQFHNLVSTTNTRAKQHDLLISCGSFITGMSDLIQPWRYCMYYGECFVNESKEKSMCFVFNDMLVWMNSASPIVNGQTATYYFQFEGNNCICFKDVERHSIKENVTNCYEIVSKDKEYNFLFPSESEMEIWIKIFNACLKQ